MFLIDAKKAMRGANSKGSSYLADSLAVALAVFKRKIIEDDNALLGITFFGTVPTTTTTIITTSNTTTTCNVRKNQKMQSPRTGTMCSFL